MIPNAKSINENRNNYDKGIVRKEFMKIFVPDSHYWHQCELLDAGTVGNCYIDYGGTRYKISYAIEVNPSVKEANQPQYLKQTHKIDNVERVQK